MVRWKQGPSGPDGRSVGNPLGGWPSYNEREWPTGNHRPRADTQSMAEPTTQEASASVNQSEINDAPTLGEQIRKWFFRASIAGMLISFAIHIVLFVIAALIVTTGGGGDSQPAGPAVEFAVMNQSELDAFQTEELSIEEPNSQELLEQVQPEVSDPLLDSSLSDLTQLDSNLDADISVGGGDLSSSIDGASVGGAGTGSASFFGIEARGNRFAYIIDVSGSMDREGRMQAMQSELTESISAMPDHVSFFVVSYSDTAEALGGKRRWTDASGVGKRWARGEISKISALGSTKPLPAFEMVYDIRPRPDAIYFMTDGEFDDGVPDIIIRRNQDRPVPVHCITFMTRSAEPVMRRIASETGGTYTHISRTTP